MLVYVKSQRTMQLPLDVQSYALVNEEVPNHPTSDQWFGESQFEAYRMLGFSTCSKGMDKISSAVRGSGASGGDALSQTS